MSTDAEPKFVVQGPVNPGGDAFVGRSAELTLMDEWLQSSRCVGALLGARQTGKTSLLLRLRARLAARYQFAFVNLEAIEGAELPDCFAFIAEELLENASPGAPLPAAMPRDGRTFMRFLRALADRLERPRLGVLLDEDRRAGDEATGVGSHIHCAPPSPTATCSRSSSVSSSWSPAPAICWS